MTVGVVILVTAVVAEVSFATLCIRTRSRQRNAARVVALVGFLLLIALQIVAT